MAYSEELAFRIRAALAGEKNLEEKKMFQGLCFMVNGKMCICVRKDEIMCRVDPEKCESILETKKCRPMIHNEKLMRGFLFVNESEIRTKKEFQYWIDLSLDFNEKAKKSPKKRKSRPKNK